MTSRMSNRRGEKITFLRVAALWLLLWSVTASPVAGETDSNPLFEKIVQDSPSMQEAKGLPEQDRVSATLFYEKNSEYRILQEQHRMTLLIASSPPPSCCRLFFIA